MSAYAPDEVVFGGDLEAVVEQLWRPALSTGLMRVGVDALPSSQGWSTVESYRAIPAVARARLLVPDHSRRVSSHAVGNYRALLTRGAHLRRSALTLATALGLGLVSEPVVVQVRSEHSGAPLTPLALMREALGVSDLHAAIRVNLNTNRKATLQLLDVAGHPAGLAKFAWEPVSAQGVIREAAALRELAGTLQHTRVPGLLFEGTWFDQPVLVAAPLPPEVRGSGPRERPPSPVEMHDLFPQRRHDLVSGTAMVRALTARLDALALQHPEDVTLGAAGDLLALALASPVSVPVAARWHGDFTPWNAARDAAGALWIWDWETSEPDAPAGMDALHWAMGVREEAHGERWNGQTLRHALAEADPMLRALGIGPDERRPMVAVHVAALAERVLSHALGHGGWQDSWMPRPQLEDLIRTARELLTTSYEGGRHA